MNITEMPRVEIMSYMDEGLSNLIHNIPNDILILSEEVLVAKITTDKTAHALRVSFWREMARVMVGEKAKVNAVSVYGGITSSIDFDMRCQSREFVAWMVRPMQSAQRDMELMLHVGRDRIFEMLKAPLYADEAKRKFLPKNAMVILSAYKMIEERIKGLPVQPHRHEKPASANEIDNKIKTLEAELGANPPAKESLPS